MISHQNSKKKITLTTDQKSNLYFFSYLLKVGSFQKVMAKVSNLSNRHACEPKIVPELLFPVNVVNNTWATF